MAGYSRRWTCERCGERQESIDYPKVAVCERCIAAHEHVRRNANATLGEIAERAYTRGYRHGKAATGVTDEMVERAAVWLGGDRDWARNILTDALSTEAADA